jgi:hypothetical protein
VNCGYAALAVAKSSPGPFRSRTIQRKLPTGLRNPPKGDALQTLSFGKERVDRLRLYIKLLGRVRYLIDINEKNAIK